MNSLDMVMRVYLEINLLLVFSFGLFKLIRATGLIRHQVLVRSAQALVVLSICAPVAFQAIPKQELPVMTFKAAKLLSDGAPIIKKQVTKLNLQKQDYVSSDLKVTESILQKIISVTEQALGQASSNLWFVAIFFLGFMFSLLKLNKNLKQLKQVIRNSLVIRRLGRTVVTVSDSVAVPFSTLVGGSAYTVLPMNLMARAKDFRMAIHHEFQHHRSGDTLWAIAIETIVCSFYVNPVSYFWRSEIIEVQEFSCDEALIGQMKVSVQDYGNCLLNVAQAALGTRQMQVGTTCMAATTQDLTSRKSSLRRRIEMFQHYSGTRRKNALGLALGTMSLFITLAAAYGAQQTLRSTAHTTPNPGLADFDPMIQPMTEKILKQYVQKFGAKGGFVIVSDPTTGKLLAAANVSNDPKDAGKEWALSYAMEPASAMKGLVTAEAIEQKLTTPSEVFDCGDGNLTYGDHKYSDWKAFGHLTTTEIVENSSNIGGLKIGAKLGPAKLEKMLSDYGFGDGGVTQNFPQAMPGQIPSPSRYTAADYTALISIGYTGLAGLRVTPLEMTQAYGAIANNGKLMKPILASASDSSAEVIRQAMSPQTADEMKTMLASVVTHGIATNAKSALYTTAGKTSTAYQPNSPSHDVLGGERGIAGFIGFAPVKNPRVVVYVGMIDPTSGTDHEPHGNAHAAPVFRDVAEQVLKAMNVAPDQVTN